jgi:hypothetical protein
MRKDVDISLKDIDFSDRPKRSPPQDGAPTDQNNGIYRPSFLANLIFSFNAIILCISTMFLLSSNSGMKRRIMRVYLCEPTSKYIGNK